jgi:hypothetical protein
LSRKQETKGMERFGGSKSPRSGARWDRKNDGRTDTELVEFKRTDNRSTITLRWADLDALYRHAVAESRLPVLVFELGGKQWVVLPEPDYHELVLRGQTSDAPGHLRARLPRLARSGQMPGPAGKAVLRRVPTQQLSGPGGEERLPGNPPGPPRAVPGPKRLSRVRDQQRGEVRRLGRNQRKGAAPDQAPTTP